jgi:hypothetical protein
MECVLVDPDDHPWIMLSARRILSHPHTFEIKETEKTTLLTPEYHVHFNVAGGLLQRNSRNFV